MTSCTDDETDRHYRYHIYIGEERICLTKTLLVVEGFLSIAKTNSEYRGFWVTVRDILQEGEPVIYMIEGGSRAVSTDEKVVH
jgi:hypothetical protein